MNLSLILAAAWAIVANLGALIPSKRKHWPFAYVLIAVGVPILGYVTLQNGPWIGLIVFAAGLSVLRWPVYYFWKWLKSRF
jgi:uncharacterized membrane protein